MPLAVLPAIPPREPRCRSILPSSSATRSRVVDRRYRCAQCGTANVTGAQTACHSRSPTKPGRRSPSRHRHYPHSAQHTAASFNPASMRSRSPHRSPFQSCPRPHRTLKIPKSVSSDSWAVGFEEGRPVQRFGLRDDQWERIKDFLPGREGHVGGNAADNRCSLMRCFTDIERESPGVICRRVSATGRSCINALADGRRAAFSSEFSSCWQAIPTTNT